MKRAAVTADLDGHDAGPSRSLDVPVVDAGFVHRPIHFREEALQRSSCHFAEGLMDAGLIKVEGVSQQLGNPPFQCLGWEP